MKLKDIGITRLCSVYQVGDELNCAYRFMGIFDCRKSSWKLHTRDKVRSNAFFGVASSFRMFFKSATQFGGAVAVYLLTLSGKTAPIPLRTAAKLPRALSAARTCVCKLEAERGLGEQEDCLM